MTMLALATSFVLCLIAMAILQTLVYPIIVAALRSGLNFFAVSVLAFVHSGLVAAAMVWLSTWIFSWFDRTISLWLLLPIIAAAFIGDLGNARKGMAAFGHYCFGEGYFEAAEHRRIAAEDPKGTGLYRLAWIDIWYAVGRLVGFTVAIRYLFFD